MTKVAIDIPDRDMWRISQDAERLGVTPGDVVRDDLAMHRRRNTVEFKNRVRSRVLAGMCDADIASELARTVGEIARVRRAEKLPANPRYRKPA